jgi:D-alanyl-D-alanine carboxypeptidase
MAVAALRLVQEGRLRLDQNMSLWLPEFPPARDFGLRQILQHTSGLPDHGGLKEYHDAVRRGDVPWTEDEFLARTDAMRLRFPPGSAFADSNIGYMLLRRVMARASGEDCAPLLHRAVFLPAGIEDAAMPTTKGDLAGFSFGPSRYLGSDTNDVHWVPDSLCVLSCVGAWGSSPWRGCILGR